MSVWWRRIVTKQRPWCVFHLRYWIGRGVKSQGVSHGNSRYPDSGLLWLPDIARCTSTSRSKIISIGNSRGVYTDTRRFLKKVYAPSAHRSPRMCDWAMPTPSLLGSPRRQTWNTKMTKLNTATEFFRSKTGLSVFSDIFPERGGGYHARCQGKETPGKQVVALALTVV